MLVVVMAVAAATQGWVVLDVLPPNPISVYVDRIEDAGRMRESMQQAGLGAVTRVRRMEHACNPPYIQMERAWSYFHAVAEVEQIPDAFWAREAARQHWQRGPAQSPLQRDASRMALGFNGVQGCPWLPKPADLESSRFIVSFLHIASSAGGPVEPTWHDVSEVSMLAYDTRTSKLYYFSASL